MAVLIPTLLKRASGEGDKVWQETSARLLELAGSNPVAFREVVGGMEVEQKGFMEGVLVKGRGDDGRKGVVEEEKGEPTIALRMDFGG